MKVMSADSNEYFSIGSEVKCTTCYGQEMQGQVMAYDLQTKLLALKSPTKNGSKPGNSDVRLINLSLVSSVSLIHEEENKTLPAVPNLNFQRLNSRLEQSRKEKIRQANSIGENVSPEAQKLYLAITKTIEPVHYQSQDIVVMNQVMISPPYRPENCKCISQAPSSEQTLNHIRKIVEKFHNDQKLLQASESAASEHGTMNG
ncbi:PREDICTED: protein LSM12 homolog [Priapulus caudatus]|uniref:Protein LSM12 homolog n=1 Tax=Priapulus caudatus TaxID=37621 RepID=A0ABM1EWD9_PRICU|nr:PREDICTED: protein LSM12 homolog [Priapulus caudatus]